MFLFHIYVSTTLPHPSSLSKKNKYNKKQYEIKKNDAKNTKGCFTFKNNNKIIEIYLRAKLNVFLYCQYFPVLTKIFL